MLENRETELDILRLFATVAVIMTHVCGSIIHNISVKSIDFIVLNVIRSAITWDVPIFIMISGRFFLDLEKKITIKNIVKKNIKHLLYVFFAWSLIYTSFYYITSENIYTLKEIIFELLIGPYHMWFIIMLIFLYLITPILRKIIEDKKITEYFILLFFICQFLYQYGINLPYIGVIIDAMLNKSYFYLALGYTGYYVLGYYLYRYDIPKKIENILYAMIIPLIIFSCIGTTVNSFFSNELNEFISTYQTPNIIVETCGIYMIFCKKMSKIKFGEKAKKIFFKLSTNGLGVYLSHALVLEILNLFGIQINLSMIIISVFFITFLTYIISFISVNILSKIPFLKRFIL